MRTIDAALFELLCEELVDGVADSAEPLLITKDGRPVAELRPLEPGRRADLNAGGAGTEPKTASDCRSGAG